MEYPLGPIQEITFDVSDVDKAQTPLQDLPYIKALERRLSGPVEGFSQRAEFLVPTRNHAFLAALHAAFNDHRPLVLSPDHFWLLIAQGFAIHVRENAETLRHQFVSHEGQKELVIVRSDVRKGQLDGLWPEVVAQFGKLVRENLISEIYTLLTPQFSTTTPIETTAFEMTLLDTVQEYFKFTITLCGIPSITLEGSPEDWHKLQERTRALSVFQLDWWTNQIDPILTELVHTAEGHINKSFWQDFYKLKSNSGADFINGWIVRFFPYTQTLKGTILDPIRVYEVNPHLGQTMTDRGFREQILTSGLSRIPFKWEHERGVADMEFVAGFVGIRQENETRVLRPEIGWAIQDVHVASDFRKKYPF